jgi:lipopolysaccharide biosynthesis glycosyltransferase
MKEKKSLIVTLADRDYINQAKQLFSTVYFNAGWKGDYMLLSHEIPEKDLKWFRKKGILIKKCKPLFNHVKIENELVMKIWPIAISKFYLFTPYFKKWKNIIFLDADIIVKNSLDELANLNGFFAVKNFPLKLRHEFTNIKKNNFIKLKKNYDFNQPAFNSGAMAFSTYIIQQDGFTNLKRLFKDYKDFLIYAEQPILNLYFYKKWKKLSIIYNFNPDWSKKNYKKAVILHFFSNNKPWYNNSSFKEEWEENLKKADLINLKKIENPINKWGKEEIIKNSKELDFEIFLYSPILYLNWYLGKIGYFIKIKFPRLHRILKSNLPFLSDHSLKNQ